MTTYEYIPGTPELLEQIWQADVERQPAANKPLWLRWKSQFLADHAAGRTRSYLVLADGKPVGQGTLVFDPACEQIRGELRLADGEQVANVNALRIASAYEGQGHISALMKRMEEDAVEAGYSELTIGVEPREIRNRMIYEHWGYAEHVLTRLEEGQQVLYYRKRIGPG